MGRGRGGRGSGSVSDFPEIDYELDIFTLDDLGNPRIDVEGDGINERTNEIGIFPSAIENFQLDLTTDDDLLLDGNAVFGENQITIGNTINIFNPDIDIPNPITLDLTAKFISAGNTIKLLDGGSVSSADGSPLVTDEDRIEYTLTGAGLVNLGINELTLILWDADTTKSGFQAADSGEFGEIDQSSLRDINKIDAVNDINYIIDENLLDSVNAVRVSGPSSSNQAQRIFEELTVSSEGETIGESLIIQAEDLNDLHTYQVENIPSIDVEVISLRQAARDSLTGEATGQATLSADDFNLVDGVNYELSVSYFDEDDGQGTISVSVGGVAQEIFKDGVSQGTTLTLNESTSKGSLDEIDEDIRREITVPLSGIGAGDEIVIEGTSDLEEFVRIDFFVLEEIL